MKIPRRKRTVLVTFTTLIWYTLSALQTNAAALKWIHLLQRANALGYRGTLPLSENLERQYDEVVSYIDEYRRFENRVVNRLNPIRSPMRSLRLLVQFPKLLLEINPLSGKSSEFNKTTIADYATDEEKSTDYFDIAVSDYSTDALGTCLLKTFAGVDFGKLQKIHETRKTSLNRFRVSQVTGIVLAASTLALRSVPRKVAEDIFGIPYERFEINVFWVTAFLTGYAVLIMLPAWLKLTKAKATHNYVGYVLEYTAIKQEN